jgi:hypothetical protein
LLSNKVRQQNFHGFDAIRDDVSHPVNPTHPSAAQLVENLVVANAIVEFSTHGQKLLLAWRRASRESDHCRPGNQDVTSMGSNFRSVIILRYPLRVKVFGGVSGVTRTSDANTKAAFRQPKLADWLG